MRKKYLRNGGNDINGMRSMARKNHNREWWEENLSPLLNRGFTVKESAEKLGINESRANQAATRFGLRSNRRLRFFRRLERTYGKNIHWFINQLRKRGDTDIGRELGTSHEFIRQIRIKITEFGLMIDTASMQ